MAGNAFIADLRDRDRVTGQFLVQVKQIPLNKNGKPYLALVLMDRTGTMEARVWDNVEQLAPRFEPGDFVEVTGDAVAYQGRVQLKLKNIRRLGPDTVDLEEFLPTTRRDRGEMLARVSELTASISHPPLREFLQRHLTEPGFREAFSKAPAAKTNHHAFLGGLLEHTLAVMEAAERFAGLHPDLDRDLLLAGALLHDIGKIRELGHERVFEYTDEGRLVGHVVLGAMLLAEWFSSAGDLDQEWRLKLEHMVLSHHGSYEFGSPKRPKFVEALVVHYLDELDSKIQSFREIAAREHGHRWSTFQRLFDRYLFLGGEEGEPDPVAPQPAGGEAEADNPPEAATPAAGAGPRSLDLPLGSGNKTRER